VGTPTYTEAAKIWKRWIDNWSQFPLNGFLLSDLAGVLRKLTGDQEYHDEVANSGLEKYIPWPQEAITAFSVYNYTEQLDQSIVQYLRDELGQWWTPNMHHIDGGMSKLPEKFYECLQEDITFNVTVNGIKYKATKDEMKVQVTGYYSTSGQPCAFEGNAIIVTTPLHIIRQIKMESMDDETIEFPRLMYQAIEDVWYGPSTKIMIQTKTRFWEKTSKPIKGGFSKTNLPIGQLHYPTAPESGEAPEKGILLVYTWKSEALQFGALHPQIAIREAVRQIGEIHTEIEDEYEVGAVQAWYNEPSAQGAYVLLKPNQYRNIERLMYYPFLNIFFAGEGISFAAGWIQGALESGLRAAYQFYARNEDDKIHMLKQT
jgi:monoamine oxidase